MKKGDIVEGVIENYSFPNRGSFFLNEENHENGGRKVVVKGSLPGQTVRARIIKKKQDRAEGRLMDVIKKSPQETKKPLCNHFYECGGCTYQTISYTNQLKLKEQMVKDVLKDVIRFGEAQPSPEGNQPSLKEAQPSSEGNQPSPRGEGVSRRLTDEVSEMSDSNFTWEGILGSPEQFRYRNKMEFTFGDEEKDGPLTLGLHRQYSSHDILSIDSCAIVSPAWNEILKYTQEFYRKLGVPHYNKRTHTGVLRNLVIRQSATDGSILVNLVTTTHHSIDENTRNIPWNEKRSETVDELQLPQYVAGLLSIGEPKPVGLDAYTSHGYEKIKTRKKIVRDNKGRLRRVNGSFEDNVGNGEFESLDYYNKVVGVLYTECDTLADAIIPDSVTLLYGEDFLMEEVLGLKFKISPFSFFQTNTKGSEVLYSKAREYALECLANDEVSETKKVGVIYDLYSGTGTIAQLMAPVAEKVYGIEIIEEAVEAARENAKLNGLSNCEFIAGDVLKKLDEVEEKPDLIILDPPRDGVNPKALQKILSYGVEHMVYISCKPTSLARDLEIFKANGYEPVKGCCVDMFPNTQHVETVVLLSQQNPDDRIRVKVDLDELDETSAEAKATYKKITDWVQEHYGFHVTNLNIAQVKRKNGIIERDNYNKPKSEDSRQPGTTPEKEKAITEALKYFKMI